MHRECKKSMREREEKEARERWRGHRLDGNFFYKTSQVKSSQLRGW